jgi:hypothetical protein
MYRKHQTLYEDESHLRPVAAWVCFLQSLYPHGHFQDFGYFAPAVLF